MKNVKGISCALVSSGTFGLIPLFSIPLMQEGLQIPSILFYRFLFSALLLGLVCVLRKKKFNIPVKKILVIFGLSALYAATATGLIYSYELIPSGVSTTIHFMYPILVTFIMIFFFKEQKSRSIFLAAFLSITGVALLCWTGNSILNLTGVIFALGTVLTYAVYIVGINKSGLERIDTLVLTFYILLFGAVIFGAYALTTTGIENVPSASAWTNILLLAFLPTVVSDLTLILAVKYAGSTLTSILGSMEPLVAVIVGILFFSETFGMNSFWGFLLILASVILVVISAGKSKELKMEH